MKRVIRKVLFISNLISFKQIHIVNPVHAGIYLKVASLDVKYCHL